MHQRPNESFKALAKRLAKLISTADKHDNETIAALAAELRAGVFRQPDRIPRDGKGYRSVDRVGIWTGREDGTYERDQQFQHEFQDWSDLQFIAQRTSRFRIAFLGESVARGYFFEPDYCPALVLQKVLDELSPGSYEVIDLAKVSIGMRELRRLASECRKLKPDAMVIWAGNNWQAEMLDSLEAADIELIYELLDTSRDLHSIKKIFEDTFKRVVEEFITELNTYQLPVFVAVPDFNLKDWNISPVERMPVWPQEIHKDASSSEVADLPDPSVPETPYQFAKRAADEGNKEEALLLFRQAVDAAMFRSATTPRCFSIIRETLLRSRHNNIVVIDMPTVNQEITGTIPGRNLFVDYCHLNIDGIRIAVAAIAQAVFENAGQSKSISEILNICPDCRPEVESGGHLLAAIYNTHLGQPKEIGSYHTRKALQVSPVFISNTVTQLIELLTERTPKMMNRNYSRLKDIYVIKKYERKILNPLQMLDADLVDILVEAMDDTKTLKEQVDALRVKNLVNKKTQNLLDSYYSYNVYNSPTLPGTFHRSISLESKFYFITDQHDSISIGITYRTPHAIANHNVAVVVNGKLIAEFEPSTTWRSESVIVDSEALEQPMNRLVIKWPQVKDWRLTAHPKDEMGTGNYLLATRHPVCGELHRIKVINLKNELNGQAEIS